MLQHSAARAQAGFLAPRNAHNFGLHLINWVIMYEQNNGSEIEFTDDTD